jgi:ABC-type uncharacterized transport system substrate-binding protein
MQLVQVALTVKCVLFILKVQRTNMTNIKTIYSVSHNRMKKNMSKFKTPLATTGYKQNYIPYTTG